ncbi:MAG: tRNA preQ1(34) S-adenosylmethionine ribosyltransferase-isomerase QueA [Planctomycetota bacterium]
MSEPGSLHPEKPSFVTSRLDYDLPAQLIAAKPAQQRDASRMLIVDRPRSRLRDGFIRELPDMLSAEDLLVVNDTRVLPARFVAYRSTGGRVAGLFVEEVETGRWKVMLEGGSRLKPGEHLDAGAGKLQIVQRLSGGYWEIAIEEPVAAEELLRRIGTVPLPPYIEKKRKQQADTNWDHEEDLERYQTVYAAQPGAIAAPTAGLHFSDDLLNRIKHLGIGIASVTLHVGVGTFKPVIAEDLCDHEMHGERFEVSASARAALMTCRASGGRVVAVGTTTVRVLESVASKLAHAPEDQPISGVTHAFFYPPYKFQCVDALLTNFHLPRSTLLAMIMAFAGESLIRDAYAHAIAEKYRFFSYGDAMLIA